MAASHSLATASSGGYAFGRLGGQEFNVWRPRMDSGHLGISAIGNPDRCGLSPPATDSDDEEIELLAKLLGEKPCPASIAVSRALLDRFGSIAAIVKTFQSEAFGQWNVPPAIENRLAALSRAAARLLHREAFDGPVISTPEILFGCLCNEMAHLPRETFRVLFLDAGNRLLADETMWEGTVNRVQIHPREVVRRALETQATALILAHNHPSGDPSPSRHDVAMTNKLVAACSPIDLLVHDHIIVARTGWFSMAKHHLIADTGQIGADSAGKKSNHINKLD